MVRKLCHCWLRSKDVVYNLTVTPLLPYWWHVVAPTTQSKLTPLWVQWRWLECNPTRSHMELPSMHIEEQVWCCMMVIVIIIIARQGIIITLYYPYMGIYYAIGNSLKAVACLNDMRKNNLEPSASHYNLVIRTLRAEVCYSIGGYYMMTPISDRCYITKTINLLISVTSLYRATSIKCSRWWWPWVWRKVRRSMAIPST